MIIKENQVETFKDFIRLNEQWILEHFGLEEVDHALARNPQKIVDDGGYIFAGIEDGEVVGVCALFLDQVGVYELARMAVTPKYQGKGYANSLMEHSLKRLSELNAKSVFLVSNTKLKPAIALYKKYGFATIAKGQHPIYSRANIVMERIIQ